MTSIRRRAQQVGDRSAGTRPEDRQGGGFRRNDRDLHVQATLDGPSLGHQRDLVKRQRPGHAGRDDEDQAVVPLHGPVEQPIHPEGASRVGEGGRSRDRGHESASRAEDEEVVL